MQATCSICTCFSSVCQLVPAHQRASLCCKGTSSRLRSFPDRTSSGQITPSCSYGQFKVYDLTVCFSVGFGKCSALMAKKPGRLCRHTAVDCSCFKERGSGESKPCLSREVVFSAQLIEANHIVNDLLLFYKGQSGQHEDSELFCQIRCLFRVQLYEKEKACHLKSWPCLSRTRAVSQDGGPCPVSLNDEAEQWS